MKQNNDIKNNFYPFVPINQDFTESYSFDYWYQRHLYYHQRVVAFYQSIVPPKSNVLHVQCKNGYVLEGIEPHIGVGVEAERLSLSIARKRYPEYRFYASLEAVPLQQFDYILLSFATMETDDIHELLTSIKRFCHHDTRIIIESYRLHWAPVLWITNKLGVRRPTNLKNWVSSRDLSTFFTLAGFESVTAGSYMLMPLKMPFIAWFLNNIIAHLPIFKYLCLHRWTMIRPRAQEKKRDASVSVIVPCRNEKGTIEAAVTRIPSMASHTEIIFVEGHSSDSTAEEIERVQKAYPDKNISYYQQEGKGKGDAVRKGFAQARGDMLIILDADLTTPPEELSQFYDALMNGYGDFINGSRLVYGMESKAMGFLSWLANRGFGWIVSWIIGQPVTDTLCGTKVLWRHHYEMIAAQREKLGLWDPFGDFDLLFGAAKLNLKIIDVPIHYKRRTYGSTNIFRFKEVWFLIWMCFRAWWLLQVRL
jgi:hypothetical protein